MLRAWVTGVILAASSGFALGQAALPIQHEGGAANPFFKGIESAMRGAPAGFPNPNEYDNKGTLIVVSGGFGQSDVRIIAKPEAISAVLGEAARVFTKFGMPVSAIRLL